MNAYYEIHTYEVNLGDISAKIMKNYKEMSTKSVHAMNTLQYMCPTMNTGALIINANNSN